MEYKLTITKRVFQAEAKPSYLLHSEVVRASVAKFTYTIQKKEIIIIHAYSDTL